MHSHIFLICLAEVSVSPSLSLSANSLSHSLSLPLSLTVGPPACFTVSRKRVKPVLSFPALHSKLPGGENRLRCHPCPNLSPRWSGKQTVELPDRSGGTWEPADCLNRVQDEKWGVVLQSCTAMFHPVPFFYLVTHLSFLPPSTPCQTNGTVSLASWLKLSLTSQPAVRHHFESDGLVAFKVWTWWYAATINVTSNVENCSKLSCHDS